jgi:hypothetical protein
MSKKPIALIAIATILTLTACSTTQRQYSLDIKLNPKEHHILGRTTITLDPKSLSKTNDEIVVYFELNAELKIQSITAENANLVSHEIESNDETKSDNPHDDITKTRLRHTVKLTNIGRNPRLIVNYQGNLNQDIASGEKRGQIHNFNVSAHIGQEGVYLTDRGGWYPRISLDHEDADDDRDPATELADYKLTVQPVKGFEYVASLERHRKLFNRKNLYWRSPFPTDGLALTAGPRIRKTRRINGTTVHVVLDKTKQQNADLLFNATNEYLDKYEPLIGPYPYKEFTILESFFSSGFAFPTFTQLGPAVISMGKNALRHGYLDHELLHSWWGNGLYVDPRDGNWCESLASYGGNYYGYILDGDQEGARKVRRDASHSLSNIPNGKDKPLNTYGQKDGAGRSIAYTKGAVIFDMLARDIGQQNFWNALKHLHKTRMGTHVNWTDLKNAFQQECGRDLTEFYDQWIENGGAPQFKLAAATYSQSTKTFTVTVKQTGKPFHVILPLRLDYENAQATITGVEMKSPEQSFNIPTNHAPTTVTLDPEYHVFRKVPPNQRIPTTATTKRGGKITVIRNESEMNDAYETVLKDFTKNAKDKTIKSPEEVTDEDLNERNVLILGHAVWNQRISDFLGMPMRFGSCFANSPTDSSESDDPFLAFGRNSFSIDGKTFAGSDYAILATVHHPTRTGGGITIYTGQSERSLANAGLLGFYGNSILVFKTKEGEERSEVVHRKDIESFEQIEVTQTP